ncbi:MAG: Crp/Fnr family transcriptional regulator [Desulfobaccales bacterium]
MGCRCDQEAGRDIALSPICIGHLWVFENLQAEELAALTLAAQRKLYKKGQEVFSQGQQAQKMFLMKGGRVKLSKLTESGDEITLDIRKAGDFLGEAMLLEDTLYPLSATCLEDTLICGFDKPSFEKLVLDHPNIGLQVIKNLSRRIDWLTSRVGSLSLSNLEDRLYHVLSQVAQEHGVQERQGYSIQFPLTHEELGFLVGAHRVSVTRALKSLKAMGRIIQAGRVLIVPNPFPQ